MREENKRNQYRDRQRGRKRSGKKHNRFTPFLVMLLIVAIVVPAMWLFSKLPVLRELKKTLKNPLTELIPDEKGNVSQNGYRNIALFGVDSTEDTLAAGNNRTDIMIIASINENTGEVKLVSLFRDTYLDIGNGNYQKANAAYAYGGPEQAIEMLNTNLDLDIQDYVTIGFDGIASLIDAVGGIEMDVTEEEIHFLNDYQYTMAQDLGREYIPLDQAGNQTLNGLQATAYCRIRYTEGGDFKRTERQKEVLTKTINKLKAAGPAAMISIGTNMMSKVRTSLGLTELASLAMGSGGYYVSDTNGLPIESLRTVANIGDQSCVIPIHLTDNVVWLHQYLFGEENYQVSAKVKEISDHVSAVSGY